MNMYLLRQQDSIILAAQRNSTKQGLVNINTQRESKLNTIANTRLSLANSMLSQNNSLSGTGDYRTNEKTVNSIYLQTVAVGNNTFSTTQLSTLQSIAAQCPLSGGEAVLRARDILALAQGTSLFYNNANTCGNGARPSRDRTEQADLGDFVQVRPNPASESITIRYVLSGEAEHQLILANIIGEVVGTFLLNGKEGEITVFIGNLPPGIYWYSLTGGVALPESGRLIIQR